MIRRRHKDAVGKLQSDMEMEQSKRLLKSLMKSQREKISKSFMATYHADDELRIIADEAGIPDIKSVVSVEMSEEGQSRQGEEFQEFEESTNVQATSRNDSHDSRGANRGQQSHELSE